MYRKIISFLICAAVAALSFAQVPQPVRQLLKADYMQGASFSLAVKNVASGEILYACDEQRLLTPASVLKVVTTATALEVLGEDYRFPTSPEYTGEVAGGVLKGDLYIKGSGDPSLGSSHIASGSEQLPFLSQWIAALKEAGISRIDGRIIADETIFDTEAISPKWLWEDIGSYYGAGSYGLNVFDNLYSLHLASGAAGETPRITGCEPEMPSLRFHNYMKAATVPTDSAFIIGAPYADDRFLYGVLPANQSRRTIKGDIPDPPLFLAQYVKKRLEQAGISIGEESVSTRNLGQDTGKDTERHLLATTFSPTLRELVRITNERSHNLYADALLKTVGNAYRPARGEIISSFGKGVKEISAFWNKKGLDASSLQIYDGSGLSATDKVSALFITEVLAYMVNQSSNSEAFIRSLPVAGREGTVRNFLKGTSLQDKARLKSGGMSRVRSYAGYISKDGQEYAVAVIVNNYKCENREMTRALERLLTALF
ncbi:MAG: D-alanyl-D-alanine carboxypeptidase/D-alanyl-D-alanine-endopeptidase [Tannerellaceae bacterium]|jgi:D-alanyl-D-alanine carboxypeptidase/D-alanyl-D-alanine-endopeptidase (penicillin-binding protein 4)|nr:D-alanyl-D-alanine carboxypeptidase/D-alanyl-D-alanine-endopeptidase [Tannerellaceae bacterium]